MQYVNTRMFSLAEEVTPGISDVALIPQTYQIFSGTRRLLGLLRLFAAYARRAAK